MHRRAQFQPGGISNADDPAELEEERPTPESRAFGRTRRSKSIARFSPRGWRLTRTDARPWRRRFRESESGYETGAYGNRDGRLAVRLARLQARKKQRDRAGEGEHSRRRRRRANEPG